MDGTSHVLRGQGFQHVSRTFHRLTLCFGLITLNILVLIILLNKTHRKPFLISNSVYHWSLISITDKFLRDYVSALDMPLYASSLVGSFLFDRVNVEAHHR